LFGGVDIFQATAAEGDFQGVLDGVFVLAALVALAGELQDEVGGLLRRFADEVVEGEFEVELIVGPFRELPLGVMLDEVGGDGVAVLALDLLTNSATGQKIVDYVTVKGPSYNPSWDFVYETGSPQDFRVEDAALELRTPYVSVNGQLGASVIPTGVVVSGPAVWFYLPDYGRFILSLIPHPELGFVKAGEIRGSTLTAALRGEMLAITYVPYGLVFKENA
jgi:hypothetical protein